MDAITATSLGPELALIRASEIDRQKWSKDPRDIHAGDQLHQLPPVNGAGIAWDHTNYRYQWERNGTPVARPLTRGGLIFNEQTQWWERNGCSWQPEKKSEGGRQTAIDLRHLGVILQPRASRFFGKAKTLLGFNETRQQNVRVPKEHPRGVATIVSEVSNPEIAAEKSIDLTAKSYIVYTRKKPFRLLDSLRRKTCRHPATCTLHPHINVDIPQTIDIPIVEEPEKLKAAQSAFILRSCQHIGHEHLSHEQDPCFSDAKGVSVELQNQEGVIREVMDLAARGTEAEELERIWQQEEERERQQEMLMSLPIPSRKENRQPSVSPQTLFHNAVKSLQQTVTPALRGEQGQSFVATGANTLKIRGGSGRRRYPGQPHSWRMREWFTGIRREPVGVIHSDSDEDNYGRGTGGRQIRHRVMSAREADMNERQWATVPELNADDIEDILGGVKPPWERTHDYNQHREHDEAEFTRNLARRRPNRTYHDERGRLHVLQHVGTLSDEARRRFEQLNTVSRSHSRSRSHSHSRSHTQSDSSGSIEVITDMNIRREQLGAPREAYEQGQPGSYWGEPAADNPRTQREWAQWDGRTHSSGASVLTRSPGGPRSNHPNPYIIDREPGLRGGSGRRRRSCGGDFSGVRAWARKFFAGSRLAGERKATTSPAPSSLTIASTFTPIILFM